MFTVYSAVEFNATVRSLANFLKTHKNIGLVVIDGIHLIENVEIYSVKSSDKYGSSVRDLPGANIPGGKRKAAGANNVQAMAASASEIPTSDDFFGGQQTGTGTPSAKVTIQPQPAQSAAGGNQSTTVIRQSFNLKRGGKMG